ncbi:protein kinase domain-containing protein [Microsporum canis CBS 113480]|uniref:EKC/KEOPS complex subunit BUD32 n=1 Tax=Arthroderma otae (strain ATCC MYA-4605 / CBS 113480) TaxID=554155 RepID=C5FKK2_ARTOC|nr:protein kinase domain-containing protein [Microsporum canis CBS 113480]EEQ30224.1 protein kinase domain-containing protein [Microsporum canis CBS 113480]
MAVREAIEEQSLPRYHERHYYPVKIGEVFNGQYRIIAKLGYGAYSTVWLAWDQRAKQYTSLKVCISQDDESSPILNEIYMLQRLKRFADTDQRDLPGVGFTRLADDIFEIDGTSTYGRHYCIASKPQGQSIRTLQETFPNAILPKLLVKSIIHRLWFSVNWFHSTCGVIHTDISPQNVLMQLEDDSSLEDIEDQESRKPSVPIITIEGVVPLYRSRKTKLELSGLPVLVDFGQMRLAEGQTNQDWWMSDLYRAPEVILGLPWEYPVDVWSIGVMTLELMEGKNLFDPIDRVNNQKVELTHVPIGNWVSEPPIPKASFEDFVTTIPPGEEKDQFLRFIRKILVWDPKVRANSYELIQDEWMMRHPSEEDMVLLRNQMS